MVIGDGRKFDPLLSRSKRLRLSNFEYSAPPSAATVQIALAGYLGSRFQFKGRKGQNGTLIVTDESVSFLPADRSSWVEPMAFDVMTSVEIRSSLGRRTATFNSPGRSLAVTCRASKKELASLFSYVNEQIMSFQAAAQPKPRYLLTQLVAGPNRHRAHIGDEKQPYETAIQALFGKGESESMRPSRLSSFAAIDQIDGFLMEQKKLKSERSDVSGNRQDEVAMHALFGGPASRSMFPEAQTMTGRGLRRSKNFKGWCFLIPALALLAVELWWVSGVRW